MRRTIYSNTNKHQVSIIVCSYLLKLSLYSHIYMCCFVCSINMPLVGESSSYVDEDGDNRNEGMLDSMQVACAIEDDREWIDTMQVNNETPILDDTLPLEDNQEDMIMDEPLEDDLCNASMMASSIMENAQLEVEVFGRECAEKGPRVGLIFETKEMLIEQLSEWAIKCSVSFKVVKSRAHEYTVRCDIDEKCGWRLHASISKKSAKNWWKIKRYGGDHTCLNPTINSNCNNPHLYDTIFKPAM